MEDPVPVAPKQEEAITKPKKNKLKERNGQGSPSNRLKIITRSGEFNISDLTPQQPNRFGFRESPMTPLPRTFKVQDLNENKQKVKKRRIDFDEPRNVLRKPMWAIQTSDAPKTKRPKVQLTVNETTDVCIVKLKSNRHNIIPNEILNFRKNNIYRNGIQRQKSSTLLAQKHKMLHK